MVFAGLHKPWQKSRGEAHPCVLGILSIFTFAASWVEWQQTHYVLSAPLLVCCAARCLRRPFACPCRMGAEHAAAAGQPHFFLCRRARHGPRQPHGVFHADVCPSRRRCGGQLSIHNSQPACGISRAGRHACRAGPGGLCAGLACCAFGFLAAARTWPHPYPASRPGNAACRAACRAVGQHTRSRVAAADRR